MKNYRVGIDLGGSFIKYGIFDEHKRVVKKWEKPTPSFEAEAMIRSICSDIVGFTKEASIRDNKLQGAGLGIPSSITSEGIVLDAPNLGWKSVDIKKVWSCNSEIPLYVENDANVAALGEYFHGSSQVDSMLFVTLGTGVGGAVIIDGKLIRGSHGGAGELGHFPMNPMEEEACNCGKKGCLEQYASSRGIVRVAKKALEYSDKKSVLRDKTGLSAEDIFSAFHEGDLVAVQALEVFGETLGRALACAAGTIDPQEIVIGGGMSSAGEVLVDYVKKYYYQYAFTPCKWTKIRLSSLGNKAGIYGAMELIPD